MFRAEALVLTVRCQFWVAVGNAGDTDVRLGTKWTLDDNNIASLHGWTVQDSSDSTRTEG